jgi:hypothetical protein
MVPEVSVALMVPVEVSVRVVVVARELTGVPVLEAVVAVAVLVAAVLSLVVLILPVVVSRLLLPLLPRATSVPVTSALALASPPRLNLLLLVEC